MAAPQTVPKRAVVIGSGPNGLAAAVTLAQAGLEVEVHEAAEAVGGGTRSAELTLPGFVHDLCSAVHPMGRGSPFFREVDLPIEWVDPPAAAAHPLDDGTAVVLEADLDATAASIGGADGRAYKELVAPLVELVVEVAEDLVLAAQGLPVAGDEHRDLIRIGDPLQLLALVRIGRHLTERDVDPEFGQPLPYLVRVRTPFRLVELHSSFVLRDRPA